MTTNVTIEHRDGAKGFTEIVRVSEDAEKLVRFAFNPSGLMTVTRIKALAAAFISECQRLQAENPAAGREAAVAITDMQKASMMAVAAATIGV